MRGEKLRVGEPFVYSHVVRIAQEQNHIGCAEGRFAERPGPVRRATDGIVWKLHPKYDRVEQRAAVREFVVEINVIAARLETEAQMNSWRARVAVRIKHEVLAGAKLRCSSGEAEFVRHAHIVRQSQARQVNRSRTVIVEFDQVGRDAGVGEGGRVQGEDLVDADARPGRRHVACIDRPGA